MLKDFATWLCMAAALVSPSSARSDWIYRELKREKSEKLSEGNTDFTQVPQYFRFNSHLSLSLNFDEHLEPELYQSMVQGVEDIKNSMYEDEYFSHIFKRI
jgi:hypothetical protein